VEYLRTIQANDDEWRRGLRAVGALLLGIGALVLAYRKTGFADPWGDFAIFLVALIPALLLYGGGFLAALTSPERRAWHGVFLIFGLLFSLFTFLQFLELIDGDQGADLNIVWMFAAIAALGTLAALKADVPFGLLAAGIAATISWLALWSEILGDDFNDAGTLRGLSIAAAVIIGVIGVWLYWRRGGGLSLRALDDPAATLPAELFTAAGLAFLFGAGILSATGAIAQGFLNALGPLAPQSVGGFATPSLFWDIVLLLGSLELVVLGTRLGMRGPAYVGAAGLAIFAVVVGLDLDDDSPAGDLMGWPLVLLLLAAAALAASVLMPARTAAATPSPDAPPPDTPPPPPAPPPPQ
jgi:hypothetical protein